LDFAKNILVWMELLPSEWLKIINLYDLRKARIDFSTVGFQIISRLGHHALFSKNFTDEERQKLIKAIAKLDYSREAQLWQGSVLIEDKDGDKKIVTNIDAIEKAFRDAAKAIEQRIGISLVS
ncbi:MAG TPA: DNA sulfur modification protein DndB, partial [Leptolyngbyaceae cyanobacterium]